MGILNRSLGWFDPLNPIINQKKTFLNLILDTGMYIHVEAGVRSIN